MLTDKLPVSLEALGYDTRYILYPDGNILNTKTNKNLHRYKNKYRLRRLDGSYRLVSLKTLYRQCYNTEYCIDNIINLPNEEWRNVVIDRDINVKGYLISNLGRIKSLKGYNAIILKQFNQNGYLAVTIDGTNIKTHRLVALAFIPNNDKSKNTVDHINGNIRDNKASNLQWLSLLDNIRKEWDARKQDKENKKSKTSQAL